MSIAVSDIIGSISDYVYNPMRIVSTSLTAAENVFAGNITNLDANNPFVFAIELQAVHLSGFITEARALTRALYPAAATTYADLYKHLSDTDYLNLFALPATAKFKVMLDVNQVTNNLVEDPNTGVSQITIARNSVFYAAGIPYSLQYPINIRKLQHGDIQVVYDANQPSPLRTLDTNVINSWYATLNNGSKYLCFEFDTDQFFINSVSSSVNATSGLVSNIALTDQFYYCRIYRLVNTAWVEMETTFTEQIYDAAVPTAVLKVADGLLSVTIPPVYTVNGLVRGKIRIDVYETKGPLNTYYGNLQLTDFSAKWLSLDSNDQTADVAAMNKITNLAIISDDTASGGRNALTFEEVQARVIENAVGPRKTPITPAQVEVAMSDLGYTVVTNVDGVTNRKFIASRTLPTPAEVFPTLTNDVYTPANAHILTATLRVEDATQLQGCAQHSIGMTVMSSALFSTSNNVSSLLTETAYASLMALPTQQRADIINSGSYFFTPFYYVVQTNMDALMVRPYALDWPSIKNRRFMMENATTSIQVSIGSSYVFEKTSSGYRLTVGTTSNDAYKALNDTDVRAQLRVRCTDGTYAYLTASPQSRADATVERTFIFDISTNYEIDEANTLDLINFSRSGGLTARTTALTTDMDVLFSTASTMPSTYASTTIDSLLGLIYLPGGSIGLTQETLTLHFGDYLADLWVDYRTYADSIEYQVWPTDAEATYDKDVYAVDDLGAAWNVVNGQLVWNVLHRKGDVRHNAAGEVVYDHRAGDIKRDSNGNPIPIANYTGRLVRSVDFYVIDASYRFATDSITQNYLSAAYTALLSQLTDDLPTINAQTLEQTTVYYHPTITDGVIDVYVEKDSLTQVESAQSLAVTLYIPSETDGNEDLKNNIESSTIKLLGEHLAANSTVAVDKMQTLLKTNFGEDVSSVKIAGLGGSKNYQILSVKNRAARLSLKKNLVVKVNDLISLEEAVTVEFIVIN
jgi:hypothetical protein